jgi:hypothetical protein
MNALMSPCDGRNAVGRVFQMPRQHGILHIGGLELEHARHDRKTVLDPVRDLPEEHLLARKRSLEASFVAFPLDRHSQDVSCPLQKGQIMGDELVLGAAVDLQHPKRLAVGRGTTESRSMSLLTTSIESTRLTRWNFGLVALTLLGVCCPIPSPRSRP